MTQKNHVQVGAGLDIVETMNQSENRVANHVKVSKNNRAKKDTIYTSIWSIMSHDFL